MDYSLIDHTRGYQFTSSDALTSVVTGLSGVPFAKRHFHLSNIDTPNWFAHRMIALIEILPLLGGLTALVERIAYGFFGSSYSPIPWRKELLSSTAALGEMHQIMQLNSPESQIVPNVEELRQKESRPLVFKQQFADAQGPRPTMEDAHIYKEMDKGVLAAVFDGHGGSEVSAFASSEFEKRFPKALADANGNMHRAFETLIHQIHQDVIRNASWNSMGSTAVINYIDKETHQVYTATVGDSESNIYREEGSLWWKKTHSIALSYVLNWANRVERMRLIRAFGPTAFINHWKRIGFNPKGLRSHLHGGVNVSRAIGDVDQTGTPDQPLVIHRPIITVNKVRPGDVLVVACDGLKDFVPEGEITKIVAERGSIAQNLVKCALGKMNQQHNDNVTVIAIEIA